MARVCGILRVKCAYIMEHKSQDLCCFLGRASSSLLKQHCSCHSCQRYIKWFEEGRKAETLSNINYFLTSEIWMSHGVFEYFSVFAFSSAPQVSFFFWGDGMCYSPPFTLISVKVMGSLFLIVWFVNYVAVKAPGLALGGATCKLYLFNGPGLANALFKRFLFEEFVFFCLVWTNTF